MKDFGTVSIAMATYNGEKFLREQLDSIYNQTYKNLEVVVTDDCSTDKTIEILQEYANKYGLKYYRNENNLGFVKNFEKAMSLCSADYIALCDQDDIWLPQKIETLLNELGDNAIICSDAKLIDTFGKEFAPSFRQFSNIDVVVDKPYPYMFFKYFVTGCTTLFKRDILDKALPIPDHVFCHDWWIGLIAAKSGGIKYLDQSLILYRQHSSNQIGAAEDKHNTLYHKFQKFLSKEKREQWLNRYKDIKKTIEMVLSKELDLLPEDKTTLEESVLYLDCFLKKSFDWNVFKYGFKYRNMFYFRPYYFYTNIFTYFMYRSFRLFGMN